MISISSRATSVVLVLIVLACGRGPAPPADSSRAPNLLFVTIDTLRADRVGAYGHASA